MPRPSPSLCFLMGHFSEPQTREPMAERENPTPHACPYLIGIGGIKSGFVAGVAMEIEQSWWRVGLRSAHFGVEVAKQIQ